MTSSLKVFSNNDFSVRTIQDENGKVWFVAKDVAEALDYPLDGGTGKYFSHVPECWKGGKRISTPGGEQEIICLTEEGLYFFLGRSDKPKALPYQMWVAGDVVPSIRATGSYETDKKAQELAQREKEFAQKEHELNLKGAEILQNMMNSSYPMTDERRLILGYEITRLVTGNEYLNMLPETTEKSYSATDIGNILGISSNRVGRIAMSNGIKPPEGTSNEFGTWRVSKSRYSSHECPVFVYNDKALAWFREHLDI